MLPLEIVGIDRLSGGKLVVEYCDATTSVYSVEQINELTPISTASPLDDLEDDVHSTDSSL